MSTAAVLDLWESELPVAEEWRRVDGEPDPSTSLLELTIDSAEDRLLTLGDDWDGEGSPGYEKATLDRSADFLRNQQELTELINKTMPIPRIDPGPDGSIDLFWNQGAWELLINIPPSKDEQASFYGEGPDDQSIKGNLKTSEPNLGLTLWLMKNR